MPIDTAISCSLCVLLLDLLLKFRMTTFRLSALIVGRATLTSSKELFNATHIAQLNHSEYSGQLAALMLLLRYLVDRCAQPRLGEGGTLSALGRGGCLGSTVSWCVP